MSRKWTEGEISVLLRYGASRSDQELYDMFLPQRTPSSIKHKRQQIGLLKRPLYFDRIGETVGEVKTTGIIDLAEPHSPTSDEIPSVGLTPAQQEAQSLMMFLSRLDEFDSETLDKIQLALDIARGE